MSDKTLSNPGLVSNNVDLGVQNANVPTDYYSNNPCTIGYSYIRFMVDGSILPCCVAKHDMGNLKEQDWRDVWHSGGYENFRRKLFRIHKDRFHTNDPEWAFCQQCSHISLNRELNDLLEK